MTIEQTTLKNGLRILTAEMREAQSVTASILVGVGGRYEDWETNGGVSHFLEHLLFKGTKKRPSAKAIAEEVDAVGGYNNAYTSNDLTNYYIKVPKKYASLAIDIIADMIRNSLLDPEEVNRERSVVLEEMNVWRDDPSRYVGVLIPPLLYHGDPLGNEVLGSENVISTISRDAIADFMQKHYQPKNMVVSVAGRVKHADVVEVLQDLMGDMPGGRETRWPRVGKELSPELVGILEKDTAQAHFIIGSRAHPYRHKNDPAAKVASSILGRGMSSRLFMNVRERKGLAYTVYSGLHNYNDTGLFEVYAGVNLDKIDQAIEAVMEELMIIREELVNPMELIKAKNQIRGGLEMAMENNSRVAELMGLQWLLLGSVRSIEEVMQDIDAVTVEDVRRISSAMLAPENLRMGIIAPSAEAGSAKKKFEQLVRN